MTTIEKLAESVARVKLRQQSYDEAALPPDAPIRVKDAEIYEKRLTALREAMTADPGHVPAHEELARRALSVEAELLTEDEAMSALRAAVMLEALSHA